jgi:4'-phosphopantetheinyl transferase
MSRRRFLHIPLRSQSVARRGPKDTRDASPILSRPGSDGRAADLRWPIAPPQAGIPARLCVWCWRIRVNDISSGTEAAIAALLAPEEQARARCFRQPDDRRRFIAAHAGLRALLAAALNRPSSALRLRQNASGKPMLAGREIEFNLSHSGDIVLIALANDAAVGVDVEKLRLLPDRDAIAARFFHAGEAADLADLAEPEADLAFFRCWTRKEAVSKAVGLGLGLPLDQYRVSCRPGSPARLIALSGAEPPATDWSLLDLAPAPGYAAALAVPLRRVAVYRRTLELAGIG